MKLKPMLSATGLYKSYGELQVVKNVSLEVPKGQFVAIVGPSGAGKSSLLHLLGGLAKADAGTVEILNTPIWNQSLKKQSKFRNKHLGFVFQFHHLLPEFTAEENVAMPLWIGGASKKTGLSKAAEMLQSVGLERRLNHKPAELSGGEQQRVAIARALVNRPDLLLADEPTGNLDSANARLIHEMFRETQQSLGHTIIMVTHNEELAQQTHRIIHMQDGSIIDDIHKG